MTVFRTLILLVFMLCAFGCEREGAVEDGSKYGGSDGAQNWGNAEDVTPKRVISTVPSITETIITLGLEDSLVGVSNFCKQPEVASLPKIGGLFDQNREAVLALEPDLIFVLAEDADRAAFYRTFGIDVICVDHTSVPGMLESFTVIARPFGPEAIARASQLQSEILYRLSYIEDSTESLKRPRVLICIDRSYDLPGLNNLFVAGNQPSYNDAIEIAGGRNAIPNSVATVPIVSVEMILRMNPEVIVDISGAVAGKVKSSRLSDWEKLGNEVDAVRNRRIYAITEDYACTPGPKFELFIERLAKILHPEIFEGNRRE